MGVDGSFLVSFLEYGGGLFGTLKRKNIKYC